MSKISLLEFTDPPTFKNYLETWYLRSQRRNGTTLVKIPAYSHMKEGDENMPVFRAAVEIYGELFHSDGTYYTKVAAEQSAADVALKHWCSREVPQDQPDGKARFSAANSPCTTEPASAYLSPGGWMLLFEFMA
jgi:hypothetical protein